MKAINVTELKANLSKYLRMASRGSRIVVKDRDKPVAQIGPLDKEALPWREYALAAPKLIADLLCRGENTGVEPTHLRDFKHLAEIRGCQKCQKNDGSQLSFPDRSLEN